MHRLNDDRGAISVVVALLMVVLVGFAAIAIDVAAMYSDEQKLQTGADAAALGIAQDCARGDCSRAQQTAAELADDNKNGATGAVHGDELPVPATGHVTVKTTDTSTHLFAPVFDLIAPAEDHSETRLSATATAHWEHAVGGVAPLPLIFWRCELFAQTDGGQPSTTIERTFNMTKSSSTGCTDQSGNVGPGAFGWLAGDDTRTCLVPTSVGVPVYSDPGKSPTNGCVEADFEAVRDQTILLPIFDEYSDDGGSNFWYVPSSYIAFTVTGYYFSNKYSWNSSCSGQERCLHGYFTDYADRDPNFTYAPGAPEFGAVSVRLTD